MYSVVMLTALSAGADVTPPAAAAAPAVVVSGCTGCTGSSCYGSCYGSSCYGSSCHGCCGGGFFGSRKGGFMGHKSACHGCSGSPSVFAGCCGGGYSCTGYACFGSCQGSACHGCHGAYYGSFAGYGSCYGCGAGTVSYGSSWGPPVGMVPYTLHGYNSGYTSPYAVYGTVTNPNPPPVMTVPVAPMTKPAGSDGAPNGANLKFQVPADTKLFVDGKLAPGTGTERAFYTPPLEVGQKFYYEVKAELVVDGKTVTEQKKVIVEAGATVTETFPVLVAAVAKATGSVAGK